GSMREDARYRMQDIHASCIMHRASCILLFFLIILSPAISSSEDRIEVLDLKHWTSKGYTRVVVDLSAPVEFSKNRIANPDRLYFDLKNSRISKEIKTTLPVGDGILKTVRAGQFNQDTVRVVLDLEEISDFKVFVLDEPARLVIDVYGHEKAANTHDLASAVKTIVLDPGHGGHDPGAVGPNGLYEKDIVLDITLKVRTILSKNKNFRILMTRDKDVFIPLVERTAFANSKNADLFISIHVNASPKKTARGVETYLLNWTNDEESIRVAARENAISLKKMKEQMKKYKSDVDIMLSDLRRDLKRDESIKLANYVQGSIVSTLGENYNDIKNLGVKNALFYVLFGARMPSVLAEVSFISNPAEENLLSKESYRDYIAQAIADGIDTYVTAAPKMQKMAGRQRSVGAEK
ncbi:MAG: N-acetylmuramoyl-L-alanine amidase, partial [Thermodesulfovibrionales bacterium]|nr:N-acetylmuramoyl-L-alanine amidase [Thermodesulfovibrionales bacterium]